MLCKSLWKSSRHQTLKETAFHVLYTNCNRLVITYQDTVILIIIYDKKKRRKHLHGKRFTSLYSELIQQQFNFCCGVFLIWGTLCSRTFLFNLFFKIKGIPGFVPVFFSGWAGLIYSFCNTSIHLKQALKWTGDGWDLIQIKRFSCTSRAGPEKNCTKNNKNAYGFVPVNAENT